LFVPTRVVFFYFDPAKMRTPGEMGAAGMVLSARLFFEDNSLRETALKLARLIEGAASPSRPYFEALGVVLEGCIAAGDQAAAGRADCVCVHGIKHSAGRTTCEGCYTRRSH
jgi:hypothetical protein